MKRIKAKQLTSVLDGSDWQRHEENVAAARQARPGELVWDVGAGPHWLRALGLTAAPEDLVGDILSTALDGLSLLNVDLPALLGQRVYVWKDSAAMRMDFGLRQDFVDWWGETAVAWADANSRPPAPTAGS
jgi:hypothetical protein